MAAQADRQARSAGALVASLLRCRRPLRECREGAVRFSKDGAGSAAEASACSAEHRENRELYETAPPIGFRPKPPACKADHAPDQA